MAPPSWLQAKLKLLLDHTYKIWDSFKNLFYTNIYPLFDTLEIMFHFCNLALLSNKKFSILHMICHFEIPFIIQFLKFSYCNH
jgi:hypothetical protein